MLLVILSIFLFHSDPCDHLPTNLSAKQHRVCRDVAEAASKRQLDPALAVAIGYHETKFRPKVGAAGEIGPLQAMPKYWCPKRGKCDPIDAGLDALEYYMTKHDTLLKALTRYNGAGPSARKYASTVSKIYRNTVAGSLLVLRFPRS